jgi:hypothetical protein
MDGRLQITINLAIQVLLIAAVIFAAIMAKRKHFARHCTIMKIAVVMQVLSILVFMLLPMISYAKYEKGNTLLMVELWVHHSLGLVVIISWITILAIRITARTWRLATMRLAFTSWILTMIIGLHLYATIWLSF